MSNTLVNKSKWFWAWQDDREEQWLGEMSRQGLHLLQVKPFGKYTFELREPSEFAYRLDFVTEAIKKPDYFQLFRDAGWEHVGEMMGWQYWRKPVVDGKAPEIFTDNASKVQKYQRLIGWMVIFFPICVVFLSQYNNWSRNLSSGFFSTLYESIFFVFFAVIMLNLYVMMMVLKRITTLKRKG